MKKILMLLVALSLVSCGDGEEGLKEQTVIQVKEEIDAQNQNLAQWAEKLEKDLDERRAFINAVEGEFEGEFRVGQSDFNIRLVLLPTIPDYKVDRTRTIAELEYELQNLNLNIQVMQWNPATQLSAVGCILEDIKPDLMKGLLNLIAESCTNTYQIFLAEDEVASEDTKKESIRIVQMIQEGRINFVQMLKATLRSSTNANVYKFTLNRK